MRQHEPQFIHREDSRWVARCKCKRFSSESQEHRWQAEDEHTKHVEQVNRARASRQHGRVPSLRDQMNYFRKMSETDPEVSQRPAWKQLADEIEVRLNEAGKAGDQPLF